MNFTSLAVNNIKKNFKNYIMYLVSAVFSVMVFYIFCSIAFNKQFIQLVDDKAVVKIIFQSSGIMVALFSLIFIWYSNNFFLKRRKKELAIYSMVGMEKKQIAAMLFYENSIIGALAILGGIGVGTLFSKYFFLMLISLMKQSIQVKFAIIPKAYGITILVFSILFLVNSIHSYTIIYRFKLIELLTAQKEGEIAPKASIPMAFLSIILIIVGYAMANNKTSMELVKISIPILILVSIGTYLLFNNLIIMLINIIKRNKSFYYRGVNMISTSHIFYRIKSNAKVLSAIAILSAVTLTAMGSTYSFYKNTEESLYKNAPFSYEFMNVDSSLNIKIKDTIKEHSDNKLISESKLNIINAKVYLSALNKHEFEGKIIAQSEYNTAIIAQNKKSKINLDDSECLYIERNQGDGIERNYLNSKALVKLEDLEMDFKIIKYTDIQVISPFLTKGTLIVSDKAFSKLYTKSNQDSFNIKGYMIKNAENSKELTNKLLKIVPKEAYVGSFYETYEFYYKSSGILIFIGMFLGILFLLATLSIISFKQLMEAAEDKQRYLTLRDIGASKDEIKKSIEKQLLITFGMPLIIAICHSTAALIVFEKLMKEKIMNYCIISMLAYILLYFIYYIITVNYYTGIVYKSNEI